MGIFDGKDRGNDSEEVVIRSRDRDSQDRLEEEIEPKEENEKAETGSSVDLQQINRQNQRIIELLEDIREQVESGGKDSGEKSYRPNSPTKTDGVPEKEQRDRGRKEGIDLPGGGL